MNIIKEFIKTVYPPRCPICDDIVLCDGDIHCKCYEKLKFINGNVCIKCGRMIENDLTICDNCRNRYNHFDNGLSVFVYDDSIKKSISRFKYSSRCDYHIYYSRVMADKILEEDIKIDYIVPVPIHRKRFAIRGYNQASLLSNKISETLGIKSIDNVLYRNKNTFALKGLNLLERQKHMKNVIDAKNIDFDGKVVMIVDDIFTTGTTINECAKVCKIHGATKVYFITIAS